MYQKKLPIKEVESIQVIIAMAYGRFPRGGWNSDGL
jgi:hypothetical protein